MKEMLHVCTNNVQHHRPVLEQTPLCQPESHQQHTVDLADGKRPLHAIKQIKELVGQGWGLLFGWDSLVHHRDHDRCRDEAAHSVQERHARFEPLRGKRRTFLLRWERDQDANGFVEESVFRPAVEDLAVADVAVGMRDGGVSVRVVTVFEVVALVCLHVAREAQSLNTFN